MFRHIHLICLFVLSLSGSGIFSEALSATLPSENKEFSKQGLSKITLLGDSIELHRYETPAQALPEWFKNRQVRPALLLYSNDPLMLSTTADIQERLMERLDANDLEAFRYDSTNPAILPQMSLAAALDAGLFSAVYWMMPTRAQISELSVIRFREQMVAFGALTAAEAETLTFQDGIFSGTVRGVPFHALHPEADVAIDGPVMFHFDLSYLAPLYQGEIKTRIYPLIYETLVQLRSQKIGALFASFSYSQVTGQIPLGSRFIGDVLVELFKRPGMLDEKLPWAWQQRSNALYLPEMFISGETRKLLLQLVEAHPEDPSLYFALYEVSKELKSTTGAALGHLADAVQRDPVYAMEYLALAPLALEKGLPYEAQRMLRRAFDANPANPFIALELAQSLINSNHGETAVTLLEQLLTLDWSPLFFPEMPGYLQQLLTQASSQQSEDKQTPPDGPLPE